MRHKFQLILLFLAMTLMSVAQTKFKEGYIVSNSHERIDCMIRNLGNEESASSYEYRLKGSKKVDDITLSKIEEFGIDNELKCIRALILLDTSRDRISNIKDTVPNWEEGHAYLKVLVEGELASLYSYYDQGISTYFFSTGDNVIQPLVYKKYSLEVTPTVVEQILYNKTYQDQLELYLPCDDFQDASKLSYTKKDLVDYFVNYHICKSAYYHQYKSAHPKKGVLLIKPTLNLNRAQLGIRDPIDSAPKVYFEKTNSISFGAEVEYIFPFNNYRWSVFAEANYLSYTPKTLLFDNILNPDSYDGYSLDYKSIDFPIGINYYIHLNPNNRIFIRGAFAPHIILSDSYISFTEARKNDFSTSSRLLFGAGYNFRNFGIEFRYYTPVNLTQSFTRRKSDFTQASLRISYAFKLFGEKGVR